MANSAPSSTSACTRTASQLANRFVKDPRDVVKAGDIVSVKVLDVDLERRGVALAMKLKETPAAKPARAPARRRRHGARRRRYFLAQGELIVISLRQIQP